MQKWLSRTLILLGCVVAFNSYAYEPTNLALAKQAVIQYHDSGEYEKDVNNVIQQATRYLQMRLSTKLPSNKKPAMVLDIDETALSGYPSMVAMDFGGTLNDFRAAEQKAVHLPIQPTLQLFRYAKANHVAVFFISGRLESERKPTTQNLQNAGYSNWAGLILRSGNYIDTTAAIYKTAMRKKIAEQGYEILLNIGDQKSDLDGNYADISFKLPNPYYQIP